MRFLGTCERLEPLSDLFKAFFACRACKTWIHLGVFVGLACDRCLEVRRGIANRKSRCRVADLRKEFHVTERMASFAFSSITEYTCYISVSFDVRLACEIEITAI